MRYPPTESACCIYLILIPVGTFINRGDNVSALTREITDLVEMLPENEQTIAYEMVKRIVLAWDSDYTKLTPNERKRLEQAEIDLSNGSTVSHDDINWD